MLLKKNKIAKQINNAEKPINSNSDFDSLNIVKENRRKNSLFQRLVVNQFIYGKENIKEKYANSKSYLKTNYFNILKWLMILMTIVTLTIGLFILYNPYFFQNPNQEFFVHVNNFYTANSYAFSLTGIGIAYSVLISCLVLLFIFYILHSSKNKTLVDGSNKKIKLIKISSIILVSLAIVLVLVLVLIPPNLPNIESRNLFYYLSKGFQGDLNSIKEAYKMIGIDVNISDPNLFNNFKDDVLNGKFVPSSSLEDFNSIVQTVYYYTESKINAFGIVFLVFILLFFVSGLFVLPLVKLVLGIKLEISLGNEIKENWSGFKIFVYGLVRKSKNKVLNEIKEHKDKESYRKYKKEIKEKGMSLNNSESNFGTEITDNQITNVITVEEIESHEANKAFLNNQGQWMYHDGDHNYFIVKNDEWIPFDINAAIHQAHVNLKLNKSNEMDLSKREKKESRFFKAKEKSNRNSSESSSIDLPDEDLDKIIKDLDI